MEANQPPPKIASKAITAQLSQSKICPSIWKGKKTDKTAAPSAANKAAFSQGSRDGPKPSLDPILSASTLISAPANGLGTKLKNNERNVKS